MTPARATTRPQPPAATPHRRPDLAPQRRPVAQQQHLEAMRSFPPMTNLFCFTAAITVTVALVMRTGWTPMTAVFVMACTTGVAAWADHYDWFCRLTGVDHLPGMPSPTILAAAGAGFGLFATHVTYKSVLEWSGYGDYFPPFDDGYYNLAGSVFFLVWAWWYSQQVTDFLDDHAVPA